MPFPKHDGDTGYFVPIHLEHVLQALRDKTIGMKTGRALLRYDTSKPFTEQSPELYKLLSDILIKE